MTSAVDHVVDRLQRQALRAASLGMFLDGFDISIMAIALLPLRLAWHLSPTAIGSLMASALVGSLVGGIVGGPLVDRFGRRALLLPNVALYALGALGSALSPNLTALWMSRFVIGLGVGMDYPLVSTVVAEYSSEGQRGRGFAWINIAWYAGALVSTLTGLALLPMGPASWRFMFGSAILPALILLWLRRRVPESPRWLTRRGQYEAATAALRLLHPGWVSERIAATLKEFTGTARRWPTLLKPFWRRRLALSVVPWFCLDVVGLGIGLYFPVVLRMQGLAHNNIVAAGINAIFLLISTLGIILVLPRLDRWGRIPLQTGGFALMTIGLLLFALGISIHHPWDVYMGSAIYSLGTGIGPGVTAMALSVEIFPTELRASAGGIATALSRLGAVLSAVIFPELEAGLGLTAVLIAMGAVALLGAWVTHLYPLEPAGKTLEAMEREETPT